MAITASSPGGVAARSGTGHVSPGRVQRVLALNFDRCHRSILVWCLTSVRHLVQDIESYLADRNQHPKPYKWKAAGSDILDKIHRARAAMTTQP